MFLRNGLFWDLTKHVTEINLFHRDIAGLQFSVVNYFLSKFVYTLKKIPLINLSFFLLIILIFSPPAFCDTKTVTYLKNSDHELNIYFINGKEPGKTMMIIGGIQGDEPGGYLAADLYADMILEKGNLIVVPRANFNSILQNNRGVNGDMNRKFRTEDQIPGDYDANIVEILKSLMKQSDVILNLHEGSGFYNPEYISPMKNPDRFGQCIIADADEYKTHDGKILDLKGIATRVIEKVNDNIKEPDHLFKFNNHNTLSESSKHKEQRKSASYFALTELGIPAFGIEASKNIQPIDIKVRYQTLIINSFMSEFDIIPEHPSIFLPVPKLDHLVVKVVGYENPFAVENGDTLRIPAGTSIHISSVIANYERGLSVDIEGIGNSNDLEKVTVIENPTVINVFKDSYLCGHVNIETTSPTVSKSLEPAGLERLKQIEICIGKKNIIVSDGDTLHIVKGDMLKIIDGWTSSGLNKGFLLNFVGFVGNRKFNDEEDRGYSIDTSSDLMARFSLIPGEMLFNIKAVGVKDGKLMGSVYISLDEPKISYIIAEKSDGTKIALTPGATMKCIKGEKIKILEVISNISETPFPGSFMTDENGQTRKLIIPATIEVFSDTDIQFRRASDSMGMVSFRTSG